ncbi:ATP synthase subunit alpha [Raphidocelis subcapitata]|uniref:ATP synthase subunit alpha n=1 Tax=Raphidocelis subcapitata TaxID=307507 RepID=A0A2V0NSN4_9CHLO|nr:ATP synthase subunit alpha [Raphidocelis subcapitata]|eukprot:GBF87937.1 ATP synthase subunit alpha [Raphidocelis subcapitata]
MQLAIPGGRAASSCARRGAIHGAFPPALAHRAAGRQRPVAGRGPPPPRARNEEEPDWDREMSIFKERTMRPNQLATLRELESKVSVGRLLWHSDGLAVVSGINSDAPLGTQLAFVSGASGVLLWHRSDNLAFVLVTGGGALLREGEAAECKIKGVLQVVDEAKGPITKKDYELMQAPTGDELWGRVVDFLGRPLPGFDPKTPPPAAGAAAAAAAAAAGAGGGQGASLDEDDAPAAGAGGGAAGPFVGFDKTRPLVNQQVAMKAREQIAESLSTGVKALDILTPLGRGASLLIIGPPGAGKSAAGLDALLGQAGPGGVRAVYASTSQDGAALAAAVETLDHGGVLQNTAVFAAPPGADAGAKLATLFAAAAAGERIRDEGGHALVVMDDISPLLRCWEALVLALAGLGAPLLRQGLIKDEEGRDVVLSPANEQELVDYEGMLVSGAAAQRRGFFSTLFMRAAKMNRTRGGGSMSLLPLVPGRPATGSKQGVDMSKYQTLSEEQKARMAAVLAQREKLEAAVVGPELPTEAVEEFMSISDGQLVLEAGGAAAGRYAANPRLSITRIGSRAYPRVLEDLAPQIRLQLAQADDARRFAGAAADSLIARDDARCRRIAEALRQPPGAPAPLEEQVVMLYAMQHGYADGVAPDEVSAWMARAVQFARQVAPRALREVAETRTLTAAAEKGIANALAALTSHQAAGGGAGGGGGGGGAGGAR